MRKTDPRKTWWFWRAVQERLTTFTLALVSPLKGRRYRVLLEGNGTGYHDPIHHVIQANPSLFPDRPPHEQFTATQGLLAHEVGHALFTGAWPEAKENLLCQMVNILEDERIETAISLFYPGIAPAIQLLGDLMLKQQKRVLGLDPKWQAFACCLVWRWAHSRTSENGMHKQLRTTSAGIALWEKVRPLVEEAWQAPDTEHVIILARQVLKLLDLPESTGWQVWVMGVGAEGVPRKRTGEPLMAPTGPCSHVQPGLGLAAGDDLSPLPADEYLQPTPYLELEDAARPLARQLADALRMPEPDTHPEPHEWRGRYAFRQELRTPETPCLHAQAIERSPRSLALYVLADRSGSMHALEEPVRLALMTLYLAVTELSIPVGLAAFGANKDDDEQALTFPMTESMSSMATEATKALIAGYRGTTGSEFLHWGLTLAERELAMRPERLKVLVVLHDGQPVYNGSRGNDWTLSERHLRHLETQGLTPIGVYLGGNADDERKLGQLFRWLVVCQGEHLPDKLGDLLRGLVV